MHTRYFAVVISVLALVCAFFGINDKFAVKNVEEIHAKPIGWPSGQSIFDVFSPTTANDGGCNRANMADGVLVCDGVDDVYTDADSYKLEDTAATLMPETQWTIKQGVDGMGRKTNKNDVEYGDYQMPSTFTSPHLPSMTQLDDILESTNGKRVLGDWAQVCLRDEDDHKAMGPYKRIYRGGKWIWDPHALDRRVWVLPVYINNANYETTANEIKAAMKSVCTFSYVFPTTEINHVHMLACAQTNTDASRRQMAEAFGSDASDGENREIDFTAFAKKAMKYIDGYNEDGLPGKDSYFGLWLQEYAYHRGVDGLSVNSLRTVPTRVTEAAAKAAHTDKKRAKITGNTESLVFGTCTADTEIFLGHMCPDDTTGAGPTLQDRVEREGKWWHAFVAKVNALATNDGSVNAATDAGDTIDNIPYPVEFTIANNNEFQLKDGVTIADLKDKIICKNAGSDDYNIQGGTLGCLLATQSPAGIAGIRLIGPDVKLADIVEPTAGNSFKDLTYVLPAGATPDQRPWYDATAFTPRATPAMTDANYEKIIEFMEPFVDMWKRAHGSFHMPDAENNEFYGGDTMSTTDLSLAWQPMGPDSMKMEHLCQATMNTYFEHQVPDPQVLTHNNGLPSVGRLLGYGHNHCKDANNGYSSTAGRVAGGEECIGQHIRAGADTVWDGNAVANGLAGAEDGGVADAYVTPGFAVSRYATVDYPEYELFRAIMFSWWYRGEETFEQKLNDISSVAHYTDSITADEEHCDSFTSPGGLISKDQRFSYMYGKFINHALAIGADTHALAGTAGAGTHFVGGIVPRVQADTSFDNVDLSMHANLKCQNTCKRIKATNGVMLVSGALYTILLIGLLLPYAPEKGITDQMRMFLFCFLLVSTVFTISTAIHAGSLQRIDTGKLECTFHNDTAFFDEDRYEVNDGTDTVMGQGLILLWISTALSAGVWFVIVALFVGAMIKVDFNSPIAKLGNDFFFHP